MKISIIIPIFNEEDTIEKLINKVRTVPFEKEIIIVDDGSTDNTKKILKKLEQNPHIKIFHHEKNYGKGYAIRTALRHITGEIVIIQDADLEYNPDEYPKLLKPLQMGWTNVVYGSRELQKHKYSYLRYHWGGKIVTLVTNLLYGCKLTDEATGYKVFKSNVIKTIKLKCNGFEFCPEVTAKVLKMGYKIYEVPIFYVPRKISEGKKIRWTDGLKALWILLKYRFVD